MENKKLFILMGILLVLLVGVANAQGGYSLNYLARQYSSFGAAPWYALVNNGLVVGGADRAGITYSTVQGNWLPTNTSTKTLRLNVDGEYNQGGADPRSGFQVMYRVWGDTKVGVQSKTWGNHGNVKLDRVDIFQRVSDTSILINGVPQSISVGASYEIQRFNWNPGDHGNGYSYLNVINVNPEYFDVEIVVWEYDEQYDSAYAKIHSYIEGLCDCVAGICCDSCFFRPNTYECRSKQGECDVAEYCSGEGGGDGCPLDMKAYWKLDANPQTHLGIVVDDSGNGNTGTFYTNEGSTNKAVTGIINSALTFDGVDDYISIPNAPSLNPTNQLTIGAWVKLNSPTTKILQTMIRKQGSFALEPQTPEMGHLSMPEPNPNAMAFGLLIGNDWQVLFGKNVLTIGEWYYVVATYNGNKMRLYINGILDNEKDVTGNIKSTTNPLFIGRCDHTIILDPCGVVDNTFKGSIDEVAIYNRALTSEEISLLYQNSAAKYNYCEQQKICLSEMKAYWELDETSGSVIDATGSGNDGTSYGATRGVVGKINNAYSFDGVDDYISIPDSSSLNPTNQLTVMAWIKADSYNNDLTYWTYEGISGIISKNILPGTPLPGPTMAGYLLRLGTGHLGSNWNDIPIENNKINFVVSSDAVAGNRFDVYSTSIIELGKWYFIVGTYDGSNLRLYINGNLEDSVPAWGNIKPIANPLEIGRDFYMNERTFDGSIDEVAIYNRALTAGEISALYQNSVAKYNYCEQPCLEGTKTLTVSSDTNLITSKGETLVEVSSTAWFSKNLVGGGAKWVWASDYNSQVRDYLNLSKIFFIPGNVEKANFTFGIDNLLTLYINGVKVPELTNVPSTNSPPEGICSDTPAGGPGGVACCFCDKPHTVDITNYLKQGDNKILLETVGIEIPGSTTTSNPAGVIFNMDIKYCEQPPISRENCPTDTFLDAGTECRPAAGPCDIAEICTGTSAGCPADKLQPTTYECRAAADNCDIAEYCDGLSTTCSANTFVAAGTSCGVCMECNGFGNCDVIGNYNYRRGEIIDINDYACCYFDTDCVYNSVCYNEGASYSLDGKTRYCTNGMWGPVLELKCDWDNVVCGYCGDIQCMDPQGQCVGDGTIIKNHFCDNGKWASRTSLVALQLLDIANRTRTGLDNYTLFCDSFENTLNYLDYSVEGIWVRRYLSGWVDSFTKICGALEEYCVNNFCVLKLPEQVIFGTSLNKPINEAPLPFIKTLTDVGFCSGAIDINDGQFHQCSGSFKVWYNNKTMSAIYSNKDITTMPTLTFWDQFLLFLKNPFQKIFDFLLALFEKEVQKPKDYEFINATTKFSRIYLDRKNVKSIKGITEKVGGLKGGEYVSVTYECYSEDICKSVNTSYKKIGGESLAFCRSEPLLGRYYVASNSSVALDLWPELTARLRTSAVKIPDTSVYPTIKAPTKAIVGYPIRLEADEEGCNPPFIYNWNFGDGQTCPPTTGCGLGDSESPTHTYWTQGTKTVTLTATDADGDSNSDTITIEVVSLRDCQIKAKSIGCDSDQRCVMSLSGINDAHATADCGNNDFGYKLCCPNILELDSAGCETGLVKVSGNAVDAHADAYYEGGLFMNNVCLKSAVFGKEASCWYTTSGCDSSKNEVCVVSLSANADAHLSDCQNTQFKARVCCKII